MLAQCSSLRALPLGWHAPRHSELRDRGRLPKALRCAPKVKVTARVVLGSLQHMFVLVLLVMRVGHDHGGLGA
jgi:hypothetical protein